ncbi:Vacuolar protein sorting-associated protein vps5 [Neolecta irregularis DAH-3]|uniref:Vacuolar protein sorting-associated protein vps5 n=1 Tax=Neolecta irregularis (strain DAH-3) TaxID=1198029 RepID=A0A1U7LHF6_NEOID|nr:Vacuolar protein sorting-associated protein vps5 [Neolecta irregularis DAH-3]|eukprot:OLL21982.1 Vacuolar protein sorting-associated protein vps5 [Neolecta irregularis DAH-3]
MSFPGFDDHNPFADAPSMSNPESKATLESKPVSQPGAQAGQSSNIDSPHPVRGERVPESPDRVPRSSNLPSARSTTKSSIRRSAGRRPSLNISSKLENLDLDAGPLGPLNDTTPVTEAPPLPSKGSVHSPIAQTPEKSRTSTTHSSPTPNIRRALNIPLDKAAENPIFKISVGDPHRIGDPLSSHTVYKVATKTNSKAYKQQEFFVSRRYKDFLWLYNSLTSNHPGAIVPPIPEKQAVGRFGDNFVESRRMALERMLTKTVSHPILQRDMDLKLFLESETFNVDVKQKEKGFVPESKGIISSIGGALTGGSFSGKFIEQDEYFEHRKIALDSLELQLKALSKAIDIVVLQRKDLAEASYEFSIALENLSLVELNKSLSICFGALADVQIRIKELYERHAEQDILTLGNTIDEYVRIVGSIKVAFASRQKVFLTWQNAESDLNKRRQHVEKLHRSGKTQTDRLSQLTAEGVETERRCNQLRLEFEEVGKLLKQELDRFDVEKVEDFKASVEIYLESAVEAQKEVIEHWETYIQTLDREVNTLEDGNER